MWYKMYNEGKGLLWNCRNTFPSSAFPKAETKDEATGSIHYPLMGRALYDHIGEWFEITNVTCEKVDIDIEIEREPKEFRPQHEKLNNVQKKVRKKTNRKKKRRRK